MPIKLLQFKSTHRYIKFVQPNYETKTQCRSKSRNKNASVNIMLSFQIYDHKVIVLNCAEPANVTLQ